MAWDIAESGVLLQDRLPDVMQLTFALRYRISRETPPHSYCESISNSYESASSHKGFSGPHSLVLNRSFDDLLVGS